MRDPSSWAKNIQLAHDLELARRLEASVLSFPGSSPGKACAEAVVQEKADRIVVGHRKGIRFWRDTRRVHKLTKRCPQAEITVVPVNKTSKSRKWPKREPRPQYVRKNDRLRFFAAIVLAALAAASFGTLIIDEDGLQYIALIFMFVLLYVIATMRMAIILFFALLSAAAFVLMLVSPHFSLRLDYSREDFLFIMGFLAIVLANGLLAIKYHEHRRQAERQSRHANALFVVARRLSNAAGIEEVVDVSTQEILRYVSINVFYIFQDGRNQLTNFQFLPPELHLDAIDLEAADYAYTHNCSAGHFTPYFNSSRYTFQPLNGPGRRLGVAGMRLGRVPDADTIIFRDAMLDQIARSLEFHLVQREARKAALLKESDDLYKTLFNSVSHELRSPLSAIVGASDILANKGCNDAMCKELCGEILKASGRLDKVIENLLNMSRLESGRIAANPVPCDVGDLLACVAHNLAEELAAFDFYIRFQNAFPVVMLDSGLTEQALYNIVYNACQYAPRGTAIVLKAAYSDGWLILHVTDCGPGFEEDSLPRVFDKFWRKQNSKPGGLGLGLSIVKGFVEAQAGTVAVANRPENGACFTIRTPAKIVNSPDPYTIC